MITRATTPSQIPNLIIIKLNPKSAENQNAKV